MDIAVIKTSVLEACGLIDNRPPEQRMKQPCPRACTRLSEETRVQTVVLELEEAVELETVQKTTTEFRQGLISSLDMTEVYFMSQAILVRGDLLANGRGAKPSYRGQKQVVIRT